MATLRLFIAIELPTDIKRQIASVIHELKAPMADVRWDTPEKLHITLKFLGDTNEGLLPEILLLLENIARGVAPFDVEFSGIGYFPNRHEPKIIWIGANDVQQAMSPLVESIEDAMAKLGFKREERRFHPHITIGRVKSQRNMKDLLRTIESTTLERHTTNVSHIVLVQSSLKPTGSEYSIVRTFQLSQNRN